MDDVADWAAEVGLGQVQESKPLGSSDWSSFYKVTLSSGTELFVKTSSRSVDKMFKGEALGLKAMYDATHEAGLMRIPKVYHVGPRSGGRGSFIVLEYLRLGRRSDDKAFGRAMASMHLYQASSRFGFEVDNTIGETPQRNAWCDDWVEFYRERRLRYQVQLAGDSYASSLFASIAPRLGDLFIGTKVYPSVLHGDLWSGNMGSADGRPTIFDPAVYYGHHEAEWGMAWAASLSRDFWSGYRELIPEDPGFDERYPLYEAYHQLNHYNLFGGGYLNSAVSCLERVKQTLDDQ